MSKTAKDEALKNLGAARKGEKRRMDQYEENVSEEEYDSDEVEEFRQDRKNSKLPVLLSLFEAANQISLRKA